MGDGCGLPLGTLSVSLLCMIQTPVFSFPDPFVLSSLLSAMIACASLHVTITVGEEDGEERWGLSGECESRTGAGSRLASIRGHCNGSSILIIVTVLDILDQAWEPRQRKLGAEII